MQINHESSQAFTAKFLYSDSLKQVADYAIQHGKFNKLNDARKNIDASYLSTRIKLDITRSEKGYPTVTFTTYRPKSSVIVPKTMDDMREIRTVSITNKVSMNPVKFAFEKIIKMGNSAPKNNLYKKIIG